MSHDGGCEWGVKLNGEQKRGTETETYGAVTVTDGV